MNRADQLRAEADLLEAEEKFRAAKAKHGRDSKQYQEAKEAMRGIRQKVRTAREASI